MKKCLCRLHVLNTSENVCLWLFELSFSRWIISRKTFSRSWIRKVARHMICQTGVFDINEKLSHICFVQIEISWMKIKNSKCIRWKRITHTVRKDTRARSNARKRRRQWTRKSLPSEASSRPIALILKRNRFSSTWARKSGLRGLINDTRFDAKTELFMIYCFISSRRMKDWTERNRLTCRKFSHPPLMLMRFCPERIVIRVNSFPSKF